MPNSLLLQADADAEREAAQYLLFHDHLSLKLDRSKPRFHCTGERLFRDRPEVYRLAVELSAENEANPRGISKRQICRVCHMSDHTLESVLQRERIPIATHKKEIVKVSARVSRMTIERLEELAPTMNAKDAAIAFGITTEKHLLMTGEVTARIEEIDGGRELHRKFAELTERMIKEAHAREISSHIGDSGGNGATNALAIADRPASASEVPRDSQPDVLSKSTEESKSTPADSNL
jgi:hypothetical protein